MRHACSSVIAFVSIALTGLALSGCASDTGDRMMRSRSPSVLLTSYAIANGMAEHGMITRIMQHRATKADIARLIAIDHNTWQLIRQAAFSPTDANYALADDGIRQILGYATPVPQPVADSSLQRKTAP